MYLVNDAAALLRHEEDKGHRHVHLDETVLQALARLPGVLHLHEVTGLLPQQLSTSNLVIYIFYFKWDRRGKRKETKEKEEKYKRWRKKELKATKAGKKEG